MLVAVTGATGLVGNNVVRFFLNLGFDILAVVHPEDGLQSLEGLSLRVVRADITNPEQIREALKGAEAVVHAAGLVSITEASKDKLEAVNVEGTKNVIEACKANGAKKLIYISSIHALPADQEGPIKETKDLSVNRVQGAYAKTKVKATLLAFQAAREGLCTVVLHPTGIVGPYDFRTSIVGKLIINALSGKLKWYVSGGYDFVDASDVAKASYLALEKGKRGENYIVAGDYISMKDFLEQCFKTAGQPFNLKKIPYALALAVSPFMEWYKVNKGKEPQMSIYALKTLRSKSDIDSSKIRGELGFEPIPMAETVKDLTNWYLSRMKEAEIRRRKSVGTKMPFGGGENFMRKGVVDSFEDNGELVVIELEDKTTIAVPKGKFICEVHVNDVVYETESGLWQVDKEETKSKLEEVQNLMDELWEKEE